MEGDENVRSISSKPLCLVPRGSGRAGIQSAPSMADILSFPFDWTGRRAFFIKGLCPKVACRAGVQLMAVIICILHFMSVVLSQRDLELMRWRIWRRAHVTQQGTLEFCPVTHPTCKQGSCCQATWPAAFRPISERNAALFSLITVFCSPIHITTPSVPSYFYLNIKQPVTFPP